MKILVDSREQAPYTFTKYEVATETATLSCGDYSLPGFTDRIAVERKALDDLIGVLMGSNRDRFERELARARHYDLFAVVVEATMADVSNGRYRSEMKAHAALQSLITFQVRHRVAFIWCGNRSGGEYVTYWLLSKYLYEVEKRFKQAVKGQEQAA